MQSVLSIGGVELLPRIEPLWYELRDLHATRSERFGSHISRMDFGSRVTELKDKSVGGHMLVQVISVMGDHEKDIAYCVSTVGLDGIAEIDSIFVNKEYRSKGLGDRMMKQALSWIDEHDIRELRASVVYGNEEVLPFYARYGLFPRSIMLKRNG